MDNRLELKSEEHLKELIDKKQAIVLHFWASWSKPCSQIEDVVVDLSQECSQITFAKVDAEELASISLQYKVIAVPTVVFIKGEKTVDRVDGAHVPEIVKKTRSLSDGSSSSSITQPQEKLKEDINDRLKKLVNLAPCMLFMKGNPEEPRCGFSRQTVAILQEMHADYATFDILQDEEVRQGLKKFSNWPTYPQLYVNGELVGGLDIIKELQSSGELDTMIPKKKSLDERLHSLITAAPIMLFMKGSPDEPKCGFSRTMCEILNSTGEKYSTFDILEDNEVRQGLKKYSNWPTYPQLYVKGELIGGLDIVKELKDSGELQNTLTTQ